MVHYTNCISIADEEREDKSNFAIATKIDRFIAYAMSADINAKNVDKSLAYRYKYIYRLQDCNDFNSYLYINNDSFYVIFCGSGLPIVGCIEEDINEIDSYINIYRMGVGTGITIDGYIEEVFNDKKSLLNDIHLKLSWFGIVKNVLNNINKSQDFFINMYI